MPEPASSQEVLGIAAALRALGVLLDDDKPLPTVPRLGVAYLCGALATLLDEQGGRLADQDLRD
jgi:hypothetical protein